MRKNKQTKKPYIAPKCEVIQMETYDLMGISAPMGGFEDGGNLGKEGWFDGNETFDPENSFNGNSVSSTTGKGERS